MEKYFLGLLTFFYLSVSVASCVDVFRYKKKIVGNYYVMDTDTKDDFAIYFKTSEGDYIGRIPETIIMYGYSDSFIVAKCKNDKSLSYYIINRNKDSDYAIERDFLVGPLTELDYNEKWKTRLRISFNRVP